MLTAHHLSKSFDSQSIFEQVTFSLNPAERVGLIGPNGCGKTTLLRILAGQEIPDSGHVNLPGGTRLGYLPQGFNLDPSQTLGEVTSRLAGRAQALDSALSEVAVRLSADPQDPFLQDEYDGLLRQLASSEAGRAGQVLAGLGLDEIDPDLPVGRLSGGQQTRLSLAIVLMHDPQVLLLDEPTNHLDIHMLEWLEAWLGSSPCAALIVSHDRTFLDHTVTRILEMDPRRPGIHEYPGNYSAYLAQRQGEIEKQWAAYHDQQEEISRMEADVARAKAQAAYTERQSSSVRIGGSEMKNKGFKDYQRSIAKKVARKAKARETKLEQYLRADERVERPQRAWQIKLEFKEVPHLGRIVLHAQDLSVGYAPQALLLSHLNLDVQAGQRIALTGPNGSGKTTLLRTLAGQVPPLSGTFRLGGSVRLGWMAQDQSSLDLHATPLQTIAPFFRNETESRSFLAYFLFTNGEPLKRISQLSYGQRARLMLACLVAEGCNLLLLDEPINHLDIPSRTQFEAALQQFEGAVVAVVHDRYFIERFADQVWWTEAGGIKVY